MDNEMTTAYIRDCKVCSVPHTDEIHEATLRIRGWLRHEVLRKLCDPSVLDAVDPAEEDPALVA